MSLKHLLRYIHLFARYHLENLIDLTFSAQGVFIITQYRKNASAVNGGRLHLREHFILQQKMKQQLLKNQELLLLREVKSKYPIKNGYLSYAVAALRSGDDIKTVQGNLGHATAAFTLDVYGHVTDKMKQDSAVRMERFIREVSGS